MNAFMIFARRRRPQVSAANQAMRTGEISKILSREWANMPMVRYLRTRTQLSYAKILRPPSLKRNSISTKQRG